MIELMRNAEYDQQIDLLHQKLGRFVTSSISRSYPHLKDYVFKMTSFLDPYYAKAGVQLKIGTRFWYFFNGLTELVLCANEDCRKPLVRNVTTEDGFLTVHCNATCAARDQNVQKKKEETCFRSFGVLYPAQSKMIINRQEQTCLQKFGVRNASQSEDIKQRKRNTFIQHYGTRTYFESEAFRQKNLLQYGVEFISQAQPIKDKVIETKKRNGTFKTSKQEDEAYSMLKFIFPQLMRQFRSKRYNFLADFYDPRQPDIRFEYNGTWTHGGHPFDPSNEEDVTKAKRWRESSSQYYKNAARVWTKSDPEKREIAKKNGINLIEFWNLDEVRKFVMTYFS